MIVNENAIVQHIIQNKNEIVKDVNVNVKIIVTEKSKHMYFDTLVVEFDEIVIVMDIVLTKKTNTIAANVTSTASVNGHSKKVRDCFILHTRLLMII